MSTTNSLPFVGWQRGFFLPSPMLIGAVAIVVLLAICYGLWADRSRLASERDRWADAWGAQAAETARQRRHVVAANQAASQAQARADRERGKSERFRREIDRIPAGDPCDALLSAPVCPAIAASLLKRAAGISRPSVPETPGAPDPTRTGSAPAR